MLRAKRVIAAGAADPRHADGRERQRRDGALRGQRGEEAADQHQR